MEATTQRLDAQHGSPERKPTPPQRWGGVFYCALPCRYRSHLCLCASATRSLPSGVLGPVLMPPWNLHRHLPSSALHWHGVPFRVLAPHLAKRSPSAARCRRKLARIARYSNSLKLSQSMGAHSSHLASRFLAAMDSLN